jgi:aminopeptidase YwaD
MERNLHLTQHLEKLATEIGERPVGSEGNRQAVDYAAHILQSHGWEVQLDAFDCIDWEYGPVHLQAGGRTYPAYVGPYSLACEATAELVVAATMTELRSVSAQGRILLMVGELAKEQIMPKNFVFYNPDEHRQLISLIEEQQPLAIICATGPGEGLSSGLDPFPVFEDGDFHIPSVYMKEKDAKPLIKCQCDEVTLSFHSLRIPAVGHNLVARKKRGGAGRIILCAHIDTKKNTPGALDNASGVAVLLALAKELQQISGDCDLEIIAFNGEDYYAVPGQMLYIRQNNGSFEDVRLVINIDGAGHKDSNTALSFYNLPDEKIHVFMDTAGRFTTLIRGEDWYEGDHSIFVQQGVPCMAVTSSNVRDVVMNISHTPQDTPDKVDPVLLEDLTAYLELVVSG